MHHPGLCFSAALALPPHGNLTHCDPLLSQVLLLEGITSEVREALSKLSDASGATGGDPLNAPSVLRSLKFVAARMSSEGDKRGVMAAFGGDMDPSLDGKADPSRYVIMGGSKRAGSGSANLCRLHGECAIHLVKARKGPNRHWDGQQKCSKSSTVVA